MPFDGAIYATGLRPGMTQLVKLSIDRSATDATRLIWSRQFDARGEDGAIPVAPVASGTRLCVIESHVPFDSGGMLWCLSTDDGRTLWKQPLAETSVAPAADAKQVVVWSSPDQLQSFDLSNGKSLWKKTIAGSRPAGAPTIAHDIVFAVTESLLVALDGPTGAFLWQAPLSEKPTGGPFIEGQQIVIPRGDQQALHSIFDGAFQSNRSAKDESDDWLIPEGVGTPVTPRVAIQGRVYFGVRDSIVCLGEASD